MNSRLKKYAQLVLDDCEKSGKLSALKIVIPLFNSDDLEIRQRCAVLSVNIIKKNLMESYDKLEHGVRRGLSELLKRMGSDISKLLKNECYSPDVNKRIRAIQILGLIKPPREMEAFLRDMVNDPDVKIRATSIKSLAEQDDSSMALKILLSLLNDFDDRVKANTIEAIGATGNENLVGILSRYKRDKNNRIRANVLKALWELGYKEIDSAVREMLTADDPGMRYSALWLIGELGRKNPKFINLLQEMDNRNEPEIKELIISTLMKVDNEIAGEYLESFFVKNEENNKVPPGTK
ncbi:MAG: HEAT repeat domain-containing protein [bacterium]